MRKYCKFIRTRIIYFSIRQYTWTGPSESVWIISLDMPSLYDPHVCTCTVHFFRIRVPKMLFRSNYARRTKTIQYNIIYSYIRMAMYNALRCILFFQSLFFITYSDNACSYKLCAHFSFISFKLNQDINNPISFIILSSK